MTGNSYKGSRGVVAVIAAALVLAAASWVAADVYPPQLSPNPATPFAGDPRQVNGLIFSAVHSYGVIDIKVEVFDNFGGDFTKYWWVYTVTNFTFDPAPGTSNGFSGFETALPMPVPDIADVATPGPGWVIDCCSGLPVEYDIRNSGGPGVMPGGVGVFSFTTLPRLIVPSTGWFHTWQFDSQTDIITYPLGDEPEVPDVTSPPNQELCCYIDAAGAYVCVILPAGECAFIGGTIVANCDDCPPPTATENTSWGEVKGLFRQ